MFIIITDNATKYNMLFGVHELFWNCMRHLLFYCFALAQAQRQMGCSLYVGNCLMVAASTHSIGVGYCIFNHWPCNVPNWPSVRSFDLMCNCFNFWNETNFSDLFYNRRDRCVVKRIGCFCCCWLKIGRNWWLTLITVAHTAHVSDMYKKAFILNLCTADESINRILKRTDSKNIDNCGGFLK